MTERVFVLGSGFSKQVVGYPVLSELSKLVFEKIEADAPSDLFAKHCQELLLMKIPPNIRDNIEHLLSYLWDKQPWRNDVENHYAEASYAYIVNTIQTIFSKNTHGIAQKWNAQAVKLAEYWRDNSSTVITFNYDCVVEGLAGSVINDLDGRINLLYQVPMLPTSSRSDNTGVFGSYPPQKIFTLLKLHGSINWFYSGDKSFSGQPIYFLHPNQLNFPSSQADLTPLIIPPLLDKSKFFNHSGLRYQWFIAKDNLQKADEVYFIGYSLPETDLAVRFFLGEALMKNSAKLYVVVLEKDSIKAAAIEGRYSSLINNQPDRLIFRNSKDNSLEDIIGFLKI